MMRIVEGKSLNRIQKLVDKLQAIALISSIQSQLSWDQETMMPVGAISFRGKQLSWLSKQRHEYWCSEAFKRCLAEFVDLESGEILLNPVSDDERTVLRETYKDWSRLTKIPTAFMAEYTALVSESTHVWQEARKSQSFSLFLPYLKQLFEKNKTMAAFIDDQRPVYDVLLEDYEPGLTSERIQTLFSGLKDRCVSYLKALESSSINFVSLKGPFSTDKQWDLTMDILSRMGFDFLNGRQDKSQHPFTIDIHPTDVRVTTRLDEMNLFESITSSVHEGGHGLYEQGLNRDYFGTPLAQAASLGIHESQSRFWENHVCKQLSFWKGYFPQFSEKFPELGRYSARDLYCTLNQVKPGPIRVEADEITYLLHIIIRFECEMALFNDQVSVEDLPELWNQLYMDYLGVRPGHDGEGVLQDIHWAGGSFGYFPTYTIGSLCAAQLAASLKKAVPNLDTLIERKEWDPIKCWLSQAVFQWGRRYSSDELMLRVTGEPMSERFLLDYIEQKYVDIYGVKLA